MKKRYKVWIVIGVIFGLLAGWYLYASNLPSASCDERMLLDHEKEYTLLAKTCYEDYKEHKNGEYNIYFINKNDKTIDRLNRDHNEKEYLNKDDDVKDAIDVVCGTFSLEKQPLEYINVYNNFVSFETLTSGVSMVYSVDGSKPKHISTPDESYDGKVYTKKLTGNWYFVCKTMDMRFN